MKVIKETVKTGELKGVVFYHNSLSEDEKTRRIMKEQEAYDYYNKTHALREQDLVGLKESIEASEAPEAGVTIELGDGTIYTIQSALNEAETEWIVRYSLFYNKNEIFSDVDFEKSLNYVYRGKKLRDLIISSKNIEMYSLFT